MKKYIVRWWLFGDRKPRIAEFVSRYAAEHFMGNLASNPKLVRLEMEEPQ